MGWPVCNATQEHLKISEEALWDGGLTFHHLSLVLGGACALAACLVSAYLIMAHATHYSKPVEQRHIIRILVMVPVYSIVAFLSIWKYNYSVYFTVLGNCYEAFAISAFFSLLCSYLAPDLHSQKDYFRGIHPNDWLFPLNWFQKWRCCFGPRGAWRTPRSGLTWFNIIWAGVFQYCLCRVLLTIVAVVTQATDTYCEESLNPAFAHIWVLVIESVCVSIAMYCLIQFYSQINKDIKEHRPLLKIISIKLVIFLSFWQTTLISLLVSGGAITATKKLSMIDVKYSLPELLINIEMFIFSILHIWAFSWRRYATVSPTGEVTDFYGNGKAAYMGGRFGVKAIVDAMNPLDLLKAVGRSARWLFVGRKKRLQDSSYQTNHEAIGLHHSDSGPLVQGTAYGGAATTGSGTSYGVPGEEGAVLLSNAQSNPEGPHYGNSPWANDSDENLYETQSRFYSHGPSPYDGIEHENTAYISHDAVEHEHNYSQETPLREQVPMPMPDPFQPPPPPPPYGHENHRPI
ncbi:hypothetical protein N7495_001081 [Penicillium taxi]|uniref:uncharacterized protein n=1 Tax=Penicillium taxi TaxID=168475 RepID=UPI00254508A2|nr:uncharacterized protein N7495_001081 [Penicillium taxi]KAJ5908399.1 hypothetical protein N7495_001081 [Penicillium taxi]